MTNVPSTSPHSQLQPGADAPMFTLPSSAGVTVSTASLKGRKCVLYFYPKDDTPGCTIEAKDFARLYEAFKKSNTEVIGISKDTAESHNKFAKTHCLGFPLLSDSDGKLCEAYGVWVEKSMYGKKYMGIERTTFLIDTQGKIACIWPKVKVEGHAQQVLDKAAHL